MARLRPERRLSASRARLASCFQPDALRELTPGSGESVSRSTSVRSYRSGFSWQQRFGIDVVADVHKRLMLLAILGVLTGLAVRTPVRALVCPRCTDLCHPIARHRSSSVSECYPRLPDGVAYPSASSICAIHRDIYVVWRLDQLTWPESRVSGAAARHRFDSPSFTGRASHPALDRGASPPYCVQPACVGL